MINREARTLADSHAKRIRELLEGGATLLEIGEALIPADVERSIDMTRTIVATAARLVFAGNEARLEEIMERNMKVNAWPDAESRRLADLIEDPAYHYTPGVRHAGQPVIDRIVAQLNQEFAAARPARSRRAVEQAIKTLRDERESPERIDWEEVEPELISILPANVYSAKHAKAGRPMLQPIADALNATFPNQPWITQESVAHRLRLIAERESGLIDRRAA